MAIEGGGRGAMEFGVRRIRQDVHDVCKKNYSREGVESIRSAVMSYIHGYYKDALDRVPPSLIPLIKRAGFCFGFLDPVSNIITNAVSFGRLMAQHGEKKSMGEIEARSLQGLVVFLTSYFRYLSDKEALRYLRLSKADLLVAVHLIEEDRGSSYTFTIDLETTKIAMTCAALSLMRPVDTMDLSEKDLKTVTFVDGCRTLSSRVDQVSCILATQGRLSSSSLSSLARISRQGMHATADSRAPMIHAIARFPPSTKETPLPYELELSLTKVLLDRIHGFYLKAISCIAAPCLRSLHHRGLLKAGHCYGPFDPVTNIILNSIWYDTVFPPQHKFEVNMICDESLAVTECRSLHGLVRFVTTLFPAVTTYDATRYLLIDNARLDRVILRAMQEGHQPSTSQADAYNSAARVACHPNPTALVTLATMIWLAEEEKMKSLLEAKHVLNADDIQTISITLQYDLPSSKSLVRVNKLSARANQIVSAKMKEFKARESSIRRRVEAVLKKHAEDEGEDYELLVICGVNAEVPIDDDFDYFTDGYPYSHINIWARMKGSPLSDEAPVLLFIQCSNDSKDKNHSLCLPVSESSKDAGRCFHCERVGAKVVHPSSETYLGRSTRFEDMARGDHSMSNDELADSGGLKTVFVDTSEDDCIYFDRAWDAHFAMCLNKRAKRQDDHGVGITRVEANRISALLQELAASIG